MRRWEWLAEEATRRKWKRGAELGVKEGRTVFHLLDKVPELHMVAVDLWKSCPGYEQWDHAAHRRAFMARAGGYQERLTVLHRATVDAAREIADGSLDFVFIDADHARHAVEADIVSWRPKLRKGGVLCGHDARKPGVRQALDYLCPGWREVGHDQCWIADG